MSNTKLRTLTILDGGREYKVKWDLASFTKAAMMYAAHNPSYFKGVLKREHMEKVLKIYGLGRNKIEFTYENGGPAVSIGSSESDCEYKFAAPYVCGIHDADKLLRKRVLCVCDGSKKSGNHADMGIDKHVAESVIFMSDSLGSSDFGTKRARRIFAKIFRKISTEYGRPLKGYEINEIFYKDFNRLAKIMREDFLTGSDESRFPRSSRLPTYQRPS